MYILYIYGCVCTYTESAAKRQSLYLSQGQTQNEKPLALNCYNVTHKIQLWAKLVKLIKAREENNHLLVTYIWKQWLSNFVATSCRVKTWFSPAAILPKLTIMIIMPLTVVKHYVFYVCLWYMIFNIWKCSICSLFNSVLNLICLCIFISTLNLLFSLLIPLLPSINSLFLFHGFSYCTMKIPESDTFSLC